MKILEILISLAPGGAEHIVVELCNEMAKTESVTLLTLLSDKENEQGFYLNELSNKVNYINLGWKKGKHLTYFIKVCNTIRRINPDVVHFHSASRFYLLLANVLLKRRCPFVMTMHSDVLKGYTKGFSGMQVKWAGYNKVHFVTISDTNYQQFHKAYPDFKQTLIYNGRSELKTSDKFENIKQEVRSYKKSSQTVTFIHVARCSEVKNQKLLIKSFNKLISDGEDAILLMLGAGFDSELGIALKKMSCDKVIFLGAKDNVFDYMKESDALCITSDREGMPMVAIEAIMAGLPILSTPVCGVVDVVKSGYNGIISKDHEMESFCSVLNDFIKEKETIRSIAERASHDCPYTISNCSQSYINLFRELL